MLTGNIEVDAIVEDVMGRAEVALIRTINIGAEKVFEDSQVRVPKSGQHQARQGDPNYPVKPLEESGSIQYATPGRPEATVMYDSPYAKPQEVGEMVYNRNSKEVHWVAENYTTPGTGKHFLSDPLKSVEGELEVELAVQCRVVFGELPGPISSKSTIQSALREEERLPSPPPEMASAMRKQQTSLDNAAESSFIVPSGPPITQ